jgi:pimeloyl-ACP methyl ester carboxylesterase
MAGELDTVLQGEELRYPWKYGDLFYKVMGKEDAQPLLLIHGFEPGASSYQWRKNIEPLARHFRVYALDLLGFGISDHPDIDYSAETYADLIHDFTKEIITQPAILVTHGLTGAYAIACAFRRPQLFDQLVLVSPPTSMLKEAIPGPFSMLIQTLFRLPILGRFIYNLYTSRPAIRAFYEKQGYHNLSALSDDMVEYLYTSAHQPNSHQPIGALYSNHLHLDAQQPFARLELPVSLVLGQESLQDPSQTAVAFSSLNPMVNLKVVKKAREQLQDEQADEFNELLQQMAVKQIQ